jgi:hypothetical protein
MLSSNFATRATADAFACDLRQKFGDEVAAQVVDRRKPSPPPMVAELLLPLPGGWPVQLAGD